MFINNNLVRSSVGRFASITVDSQVVGAGTTWISPAITLEQSEHAFLWKGTMMNLSHSTHSYLNIRINGASAFDDRLSMPAYPGTTQGFTDHFENMYFPPNSIVDLTITNPHAVSQTEFSGHIIIYRFYDTDLVQDYESPACPLWMREPPAWLVQALLNVSGG